MTTDNKKFIQEVDLNKSSKACPTCASECEKINKRINGRELSDLETKEVPQILKVFNISFVFLVSMTGSPLLWTHQSFHGLKINNEIL